MKFPVSTGISSIWELTDLNVIIQKIQKQPFLESRIRPNRLYAGAFMPRHWVFNRLTLADRTAPVQELRHCFLTSIL